MVDDAHCSMLIAHRLDSVVVLKQKNLSVIFVPCSATVTIFLLGTVCFLLKQIKHKKVKIGKCRRAKFILERSGTGDFSCGRPFRNRSLRFKGELRPAL